MTALDATGSGCPVPVTSVDLIDPTLYSDRDAPAAWRQLRSLDRLSWHQVDATRGFWSVVTLKDADFVLRNTGTFTSERGTMLELLGLDDPAGGQQLAVTDPPRHTIMLARLKKALAIKAVHQQEEMIRHLVSDLIAPLGDGEPFDFGQAMLRMPMSVTGTMMGVPESDWPSLNRLTTVCIAADDPEYQGPTGRTASLSAAHHELFAYFRDLFVHRREHLGDDLISMLIATRFEGRHMSTEEIVSNCYSLLLGANVTTPHAPNFVLAEFIETDVLPDWAAHPEVAGTAIEEALRWASPVNHLLRYATRDVVVRGTPIAAGDAVVVWLGAANRDEEEFSDAATFDIRRKPNKHLAFGIGPHYCVGHSVARVVLRILFDGMLSRFDEFRPAAEPERLISNFVSGYKHVVVTARRRGGHR